MPKRIIDGEGLWRSDKLGRVEPPSFRSEYANLLPLAMANGSFEANPHRIWCAVYSYNRPDITLAHVEQILAEFERVKLLFRWIDEVTGKEWGYWVGIEKPGRLPTPSRQKDRHERTGVVPPTEKLAEFMGSPMGTQRLTSGHPIGSLGSGSGSGSSIGSGIGSGSRGYARKEIIESSNEVPTNLASGDKIRQIVSTHPGSSHLKNVKLIPVDLEEAISGAVDRDGFDLVIAGTRNLAEAVALWPLSDLRFVPNPTRFYRDSEYLKPSIVWDRTNERPFEPGRLTPQHSCNEDHRSCDSLTSEEEAWAIEFNRRERERTAALSKARG